MIPRQQSLPNIVKNGSLAFVQTDPARDAI